MPTYDYTCKACGHQGEKNVLLAKMNELQECPGCKTVEWERQFSSPSRSNFTINGYSYESTYGKKAFRNDPTKYQEALSNHNYNPY